MKGLHILSTGRYIPERTVTNEEMGSMVDTSDEWIRTRTGIRSRHFAAEDQSNTDMAARAAEAALKDSGIDKSRLCACVVATFTPDCFSPSVACMIHERLGFSEDMISFDINAGCSGFVYGLSIVHGLLLSHPGQYALLVGSEVISRFIDMSDRSTCVLFGDGAAAVVVGLSDDYEFFAVNGTRGQSSIIKCPSLPRYNEGEVFPKLRMDGKDVFKFAVDIAEKCINEVLDGIHKTIEDIDYVVLHQANERIISHVYKSMHAPKEKFFVNLGEYGNTSGASIPIALDEMNERGLLKPGTRIVLASFGSGLTWSGTYLEF